MKTKLTQYERMEARLIYDPEDEEIMREQSGFADPHVVAYGNPCRVIRTIGERDKETFYKGEQIDWENLK